MQSNKLSHIQTINQIELFDQHLMDKFNDRILFSGPFGAGKTTFLNEYFSGKDELLVLKLFPVNYSMSTNQDIFEQIKFELLYELLDKFQEKVSLNKDEYDSVFTRQILRLNNIDIEQPLKLMIKAMPSLGIDIVDQLAETISSMVGKGESIGEKSYGHLRKYIDNFKDNPGKDYQSDQVTDLLTVMLSRIRESADENTQLVLLIDDLDRLDPEHVFRLFNVFSSHYDEDNSKNKFGFDKIIFVCDINNIRQMFSHRYGLSVEFNGYIDKFFSSEVFHFNIKEYLKGSIKSIIQQRANLHRHFLEGDLSSDFLEKYDVTGRGGFLSQIEYVMRYMIDYDRVRLRNFQRFQGFSIPNRKFSAGKRTWAFAYFPVLVLLSNLERFFARPKDLEDSLEVIYKQYPSDYNPKEKQVFNDDYYQSDSTITHCIPFLIEEEKSFSGDFDRDYAYFHELENESGKTVYLHYSLGQNFHFDYVVPVFKRITSLLGEEGNREEIQSLLRPNPFWFLYLTYKILRKKGIM